MTEEIPGGQFYLPPPSPPRGLPHWQFRPELSDTEYHGDRSVASSSVLKPFMESAAHAAFRLAMPDQDTDAKRLGRQAHCAVLQPWLFEEHYAPGPDLERSDLISTADDLRREIRDRGETPKGSRKADLQSQLIGLDPSTIPRIPEYLEQAATAAARGREVIAWKNWVRILGIRDAVKRSAWCRAFLTGAWCESSVYWTDPEHGVSLKCRPDGWRPDIGIVADLKLVHSLDERALKRTVDDLHYDLSAAMYLTGTGARQWVWIFVEDSPRILAEGEPAHAVKIRFATRDGWLHDGREKFRRCVADYARAVSTGDWPCWEDRAEPLDCWRKR